MVITLRVRRVGAADNDDDHQGGQTSTYLYRFAKEEVLVGRDQHADLRLPDREVSLFHLRLVCEEGRWLAVDEDSTNGTWLDGRRLSAEELAPLNEGSRLAAGPFEILVGPWGAEEATPPEDTARFARQLVLEILGGLEREQAFTLEVQNGPEQGQQLAIPRSSPAAPLIVGRGEGCDLRLSDADASRRHLELHYDEQEGTPVVKDLGSKNGLVVNGSRLEGSHALRHGDEVLVGATRLRFTDPTERYLDLLQQQEDQVSRVHEVAPEPRQPGPATAMGFSTWRGETVLFVLVGAVVVGALAAILYLLL